MTAEAPPRHEQVRPGPPPAARRGWLLPAALGLLIVGVLAGLLLGRGAAGAGGVDPVSVGFSRDMSTHHANAVALAEIAHRRSADPELNYLAFDILSTQQGQIGIMSGWLELWGQTQSAGGRQMAWMGHTGPMPGLATDEEVAGLKTLPVPAMEEQWLRLMIRHHRGALPMADAAAEGADSPEVARLAAKMSAGQQSEIDAMQAMLRARGLPPEPEAAVGHDGNAGHGG